MKGGRELAIKMLKDWTIKDALTAHSEGFDVIGHDGKIAVTNCDSEEGKHCN